MAAREDSGSVTWWSVFLQSWASSTLDVYERHLRNIRQRSLLAPGYSSTQILQDSLLELFRGQLTSSDMRQAISACRMLEEMGIAKNFVPRAVWRAVGTKDRCSKFRAREWGSVAAIWTMAQAAESDEDLLVCSAGGGPQADGYRTGFSRYPPTGGNGLNAIISKPMHWAWHASIARHATFGDHDGPSPSLT